ncbi:radical SAM/SPASM domain-containing protein [Inhella sp.]|uniref:radical SAM/SPASM domain-containing protein n=1 Tax=Inhella sp. TaxID=1921806 RepID=UPI0035B106A7
MQKLDLADLSPPLGLGQLKVLIDVSNKCNLRCTMCHFSFDEFFYRPAEHLNPEQFDRIAAQIFPFAHTVVLSAGSEPTVSPHFQEILDRASQWPLKELKFLTNGIKLTTDLCAAILRSKVTQIDVSIDGARAQTYERIRRGASFERLTTNLARLRDMKAALGRSTPLVQFNVTLMRDNLEELDEFVDLAEALGVARIGCRLLMPYAGLDMEAQSLVHMPHEANQHFERFMRRVERSPSVQLITFPDFFPGDQTSPPIPSHPSRSELGRSPRTRCWAWTRWTRLPLLRHLEPQPIGCVDLPAAQCAEVRGALDVAGWALARDGIDAVTVRLSTAAGTSLQKVAKRIHGSRPDVALARPGYPQSSRAGWICRFESAELQAAQLHGAVCLEVLAKTAGGAIGCIGSRELQLAPDSPSVGAETAFCRKPFNSVYVNSTGDVFPYPDCRIQEIGNLLAGDSFPRLWAGPTLRNLRQAILSNQPPSMCRTCPNFINRAPGDSSFHRERSVVRVVQAL